MNSKKIIIIFACLFIAILSFFGLTYITETNGASKNVDFPTITPNIVLEEKPLDQPEVKGDVIKPSENYFNYTISSGESSYTVKKTFFPSKDVMVTGVTSSVKGEGYISKDFKEFYAAIDVDLTNLKTDSAQRDVDVQKLFTTKIATLTIKSEGNDALNVKDGAIDQKINGEFNINGVAKTLPVNIKGVFGEQGITMEGSTNIVLSEFNITPPNLLNVFKVEDKAEVKFKIVGVVAN